MTRSERECCAVRLAFATARRMRREGRHVAPEDEQGAALLGAAKALAQWDPARGVAFRSYALDLIIAEIREERRRGDYLSRFYRGEARRIEAATGEWPEWAREPLSLEEEGLAVAESLLAPDDVEAEALARIERAEWRRLIDRLPPWARSIYLGRYFEDLRPADLCRRAGKSDRWATTAERECRARLRAWAEAAGLAP